MGEARGEPGGGGVGGEAGAAGAERSSGTRPFAVPMGSAGGLRALGRVLSPPSPPPPPSLGVWESRVLASVF